MSLCKDLHICFQLNTSGIPRQISILVPSVELHENLSIGNGDYACRPDGRTYWRTEMTKLIGGFLDHEKGRKSSMFFPHSGFMCVV